MNTTRTLAILALVACAGGGSTELDSQAAKQNAVSAGEQSADLGELPTDADESTIQSSASGLVGPLQNLASEAQTAQALDDAQNGGFDLNFKQDGSNEVSWDGTTMIIRTTYDSGSLTYDYDVNMSFTDAAGGGTVIDGTYNVSFVLGGIVDEFEGTTYDLSASYSAMTTDADGCPISGSIAIDYDIDTNSSFGSVSSSGSVDVTFNGCGEDAVTVVAN